MPAKSTLCAFFNPCLISHARLLQPGASIHQYLGRQLNHPSQHLSIRPTQQSLHHYTKGDIKAIVGIIDIMYRQRSHVDGWSEGLTVP